MSKQDVEYQRLMISMNKVLKLFKEHLSTMTAINEHMDYKMTQPLIKTHQELTDILREMRIQDREDIN